MSTAYNDHDDLDVLVGRALAIPPQSIDGTVTGGGIDLAESGAYLLAIVSVGAVASGATGTVQLQSSLNDNSSTSPSEAADAYADIAGASVAISGASAGKHLKIAIHDRAEKYVNAVVVTTDSILIEVTFEYHTSRIGAVQTSSW